MVSRRMAMVETSDDQNGVVVHKSIGQRSGANQDPRSDWAIDASYFGGLWCSSLATLGNNDIPSGGQQLYYGSSSSRSAVLDTTGELTTVSTIWSYNLQFCVYVELYGRTLQEWGCHTTSLRVKTLTCEWLDSICENEQWVSPASLHWKLQECVGSTSYV